jgi:hypothetical protein
MFILDIVVYVWAGFCLFWFISEKVNPFAGVWSGEKKEGEEQR